MKAQGAIVVLVIIGACILAFNLPVMLAGGRPDTHDDIILLPRHTATSTPLDRALTQEAFALLFFTPTSSLIIPISGGETLVPSLTSTYTLTSIVSSGSPTPTLSFTPTSRSIFFPTATIADGNGPLPTSTRTPTLLPRPTLTLRFTPTLTRTMTATPTIAPTLQPTSTMIPSPTATPGFTDTPRPTNTPRPPNTHRPTQQPSDTPEPEPTDPPAPSDTPVPPIPPSETPSP